MCVGDWSSDVCSSDLLRQLYFFRVEPVRHICTDTLEHHILQICQVRAGLVAAHFRCALVHPAADITYPGAVCPGRTASLLHDTAAAAAHYFPCQRMDPAADSTSGAPLHHPLNRFKRFSLNDSFMHIFYNDPLRFWNPNRLFRLVTYLFMLSLDRKSTRLNSSHRHTSRMPSSA